MSVSLNNAATADRYTLANSLECPGTVGFTAQILNAAVYLQFGRGVPAPIWETEEFFSPVVGGLDRVCDAVRARSAVAGIPGRVTLVAKVAAEVGG